MLIRFNVGNYLSFNDVQEFSMISGNSKMNTERVYSDENISLLKFSAVYGANASGKSNLISAMDFSRNIIVKGFPEGHTLKYCKVNWDNKNKESYFEFEIKIEDRYYSYGFETVLNMSSITTEWLYEILPDNNERKIFSRNVKNKEYSINKEICSDNIINKLNIYAEDIKEDDSILFLTVMNSYKDNLYKEAEEIKILKDIYTWLEKYLDINHAERDFSDYSYFISEKNIEEIGDLICSMGTGIKKVEIVDVPADNFLESLPKQFMKKIISHIEYYTVHRKKNKEDSKAKERFWIRNGARDFFILESDEERNIKCKVMQFMHNNMEMPFNLYEESDGTIRILDFLEIILNKTDNKTYVIDEIDRCLHPQLTYRFIELYMKLAYNRNAQLIVTTHEAHLLDFNLLRRDEIWFVNKNVEGESRIYSLEEYNTRFDQKLNKAYLEGRYGGVPVFTHLANNIFHTEIENGYDDNDSSDSSDNSNSSDSNDFEKDILF